MNNSSNQISQLQSKVNELAQEKKQHFLDKSQLEDKLAATEKRLFQWQNSKDKNQEEISNLQNTINKMKKKDLETTKRMNLFALAKSNKEFSELVSDEELKAIHQ